MILKWAPHTGSDGSGRTAVQYLVADRWTKVVAGQKVVELREPKPEILRGDPELVARAIAAAPGKLKYSSAVASLHLNDVDVEKFNSGDPAARAAVSDYIDGWHEAAFSGLPRSAWPPVLVATHTHTKRLELNFLCPRAIMVGDKLRSYNPAPPGPASRRIWNALTDSHNLKNRWADPLDPARERAVRVPDHILKDQRAAGRLALRSTSRKDVRELIADQIARRVDEGEITDRASVLRHLQSAGFEVVRTTKRSITIADPNDVDDHKKRLRLEGPIFVASFDAPTYLAARHREHPGGATQREMLRDEFLITAPERLEKELKFRAQTNHRLASEIAAATPPAEPVNLDADRIYFRRLSEPEPDNPLEFSDDRDASGRIHRRVRDVDAARISPAVARAQPDRAPGRPGPARADSRGATAERPAHAPRSPGGLRLPDAVLARANRTGKVFESKDNLRTLSRRHLDRGSRISAMPLHSDAHDIVEQRGPAALAEMRRRNERDRRLFSQAARLARSEWSLEKRTEWKQRYLDRLYSGPPLDVDLLKDIRYIDTRAREIQFWDGCTVRDEGDKITADWATQSSIELLVAQARAAGWQSVKFTGRDRDVAALVVEAHRLGLSVDGHPAPEPAPSPTAGGAPERPEPEKHMPTPDASTPPKPGRARPQKFIPDPPDYKDRVRRDVDLRALAEAFDYRFDPEKSSKTWPCYKHVVTGRRLLISQKDDRSWIWQDRETKRGGDAFHLAADVLGLDLKADFPRIKRELARFVGSSPSNDRPPPRPLSAADKPGDFSAIRAAWEAAGRVATPDYLTQARMIPPTTLTDQRFADTFRVVRGDVAFPYFNRAGELTGFERRRTPTSPDQPKASFSEGGKVGIWKSNSTEADTALTVCESPIDCMSHYFLNPNRRATTRYVALRTGAEPAAGLREAIRAMPADAVIVGACDAGEAGEGYQMLIEQIAREEGRRFVEHRSRLKKDWNDELRARVTRALAQIDQARQGQAAAPAPIERPAEPAAAQRAEQRAAIEELQEDDGPEPGM